MFGLRRKLSGNLALLVLAPFTFISVWGMGIGMEVMDGQMSSCPFMAGQATMCQMSVTEHIAQWQRVLLGVPKGNPLILFASLLAMTLIPFVKVLPKIEDTAKFAATLAYQKTRAFKIFDLLLIAFSDGILNPKIY